MMQRKLGFIGLGKMGGLMARRLVNAGHEVIVFDAVPAAAELLVAAGATQGNSPRDIADRAEVVFASLPTPGILREVALGADGVVQGAAVKVFVDTSTTGPRAAIAVAAGLLEKGIAAIDCPVSGGLAGARDGKLTLMISGPRETFEALRPVFETLGKPLFVAETPGAVQTVKLANNLLVAGAMAVTAEAMVMGVKAGVDPAVMCEVINVSSGRNTATVDKFPRAVLTGSFNFGFSTGLAYKDVRLCLDEAEALGVPTPVGAAVRQAYAIVNAVHGPDSDFSAIVKPLEAWTGVAVRSVAPPDGQSQLEHEAAAGPA
jgi:3-hydroxyisobutyrate dehydrogenase-like beta-hydroxyacid dehydrogenase